MLAAAVREDSEQHNAHHGTAWHQVRAPGWATKNENDNENDNENENENENDNDNDNGNGNGNYNDNEKSVKSVTSDVDKENNR